METKIIKELKYIVGKEFIYSDYETRLCYAYDALNRKYLPDLVVLPGSTAEISTIMVLANREHLPVTPRGAGSGLTGGALAVNGGVIVSLERMKRIIKIDEENLIAVVEPGVITGDLHRAVENRGLFYPPDPASLDFCTLGGNVAECAGGLRAVKYGVTKDYVLGLEVVLPTGEVISTGVETVKGVVGYDLTKLLVGSEGTLGIITRIILKLIPKPPCRITLLAIYDKVVDAARTVTEILKARLLPATLEFMDQNCIRAVESYLQMGLPTDAQALLLIEDDGGEQQVRLNGEKLKQICQSQGAREVKIARNENEAEDFWRARRAISPSLGRIAPQRISEDVTVPRNLLPQLIEATQQISQRFQLNSANFGHAGDGNIHVNILCDPREKEEWERAEQAIKEILIKVVEMGGTISGEHGIGVAKLPYIGIELGEAGISLMKKIKTLFDPNNILNPGKIFPEINLNRR